MRRTLLFPPLTSVPDVAFLQGDYPMEEHLSP